MDGWNREIMDMIYDLQHIRACQKQNAKNIGDKDKYGYPFEPADCFSSEPLGFLETAMRLETEALETSRFMKQINRHSPVYYQMSSQLEKLVSQLGSVCITKAVMEQQGKDVSFLDHLTIDWLRELTAYNFRKCYASFMESMSVIRYNGNALGLSTRWAALDKRLLATAEKIELIKAGKLKVSMSDPAEKLKNEIQPTAEKQEEKPETVSPMASKGRAFSVDKEAFRGMEREDSGQEQENMLPVPADPGSEDTLVKAEASGVGTPEKPYAEDMAAADTGKETAKSESTVPDEFADPDTEDPDDDWEDPGCEEEAILPYVTEEMVQRMSALWNDPDLMSWAYRQTAANASP